MPFVVTTVADRIRPWGVFCSVALVVRYATRDDLQPARIITTIVLSAEALSPAPPPPMSTADRTCLIVPRDGVQRAKRGPSCGRSAVPAD